MNEFTPLTLRTPQFFCTVLPQAVKDELFDEFAIDNYKEKYFRCKQ